MKSMAGILILLSLPAFLGAQSLGEAARKEEERKKKSPSPPAKARTVTDEDLQTIHGTEDRQTANPAGKSVPPPPSPSRYQAARPATPDSDRTRQDEQQWRRRMTEARARVDKAQRRHDALSRMSLVPGEYYVDGNNRVTFTSPEQIQAAVRGAKAEMDAAHKAIDDLEEQARRSNVPPGWLR